MAHLLQLQQGRDKRHPIRSLDLVAGNGTDPISLQEFAPGPGRKIPDYSGLTSRRDGQVLITEHRDNANLRLTYILDGSTPTRIGELQRQIARFFNDAQQHNLEYVSEPVYIRYRWHDGLSALPEPIFGQFSHFLKVLSADVPAWPDALSANVASGTLEQVLAELTCEPYAEGLRQEVGIALGHAETDEFGVFVGLDKETSADISNRITNPSFGHSTWNTGWTASGDLTAINETRPGLTRSLGSAARLISSDSANFETLTQSLTVGGGGSHVLSFHAKRPNGQEITNSHVKAIVNSSETTVSVKSLGDGWYFCYCEASAIATPQTYGVAIAPGEDIIVDDIMMRDSEGGYKFNAGWQPFMEWAGTEHNSNTEVSQSTSKLSYDYDSSELSGHLTLSGWATVWWDDDSIDSPFDPGIVRITDSSGDNEIAIFYDVSLMLWTLRTEVATVAATDTSATPTVAALNDYHFAIVQDTTTTKLYINGTEVCSISQTPFLPSGTLTIQLGVGPDGGADAGGVSLDGWRGWQQALSATEVQAIYDAESGIKSNGGIVGMPPFLWTPDGDNGFDNVDGIISTADKDNWLIISGIPGDYEAITEYQLTLPTSSTSRVVWLGRRASQEMYDPDDTNAHWLDFSGTADVGNSSGDAYESDTSAGTGTDTHTFDATVSKPEHLKGPMRFVGRFKVTGAAADVQPYFQLGGSELVKGEAVNIATNANFLFRDFGELFISWPQLDIPTTFKAGLFCTETAASATTWQLDFLQLLPEHHARVEAKETGALTVAAADLLVIDGLEAYILDASDSWNELYKFDVRGKPVTLRPNAYNYLFVLMAEEGQQYQVSQSGTLAVFVTPRWELPGGRV